MVKGAAKGGYYVRFTGEATPDQVWSELRSDPHAALVDVRTAPEWAFVGGPDLSDLAKAPWRMSWRLYPGMKRDEGFLEELGARIEESGATKIFMICRSGARSLEAAQAAAEAFAGATAGGGEESETAREVVAVNVKEGFEGDLDEQKQRGRLNGWKARGLPWAQS